MREIALIDYTTKVFTDRIVLLDMSAAFIALRRNHPTLPKRKFCDFIVLVGNESIATGKRFTCNEYHKPFTEEDMRIVTTELLTKLTQLFGSVAKLTEAYPNFIFQVTQRRGAWPGVALVDARSDNAVSKLTHISF